MGSGCCQSWQPVRRPLDGAWCEDCRPPGSVWTRLPSAGRGWVVGRGYGVGGGAFGRSFSLPAFCVLLSLSLPRTPHPNPNPNPSRGQPGLPAAGRWRWRGEVVILPPPSSCPMAPVPSVSSSHPSSARTRLSLSALPLSAVQSTCTAQAPSSGGSWTWTLPGLWWGRVLWGQVSLRCSRPGTSRGSRGKCGGVAQPSCAWGLPSQQMGSSHASWGFGGYRAQSLDHMRVVPHADRHSSAAAGTPPLTPDPCTGGCLCLQGGSVSVSEDFLTGVLTPACPRSWKSLLGPASRGGLPRAHAGPPRPAAMPRLG